MVFSESLLYILDNSGVRLGKILRVFNKRGCGSPGDSVIVSVRKYVPNKKVKKGMMFRAVIIKTKKNVYRLSGQYIKCNMNAGILVKKEDNTPVAKRVKSLVFFELRQRGFSRLVSMAEGII